MTTEERLEKLEREVKEMNTLICTKALFAVKDVEETMGKAGTWTFRHSSGVTL